jgi:hypothetical protein
MLATLAGGLLIGLASSAAACTPEEIAGAVERAGLRLRQLASETQPRLQAKMRQLGERERWSAGEIEDKAYAFVTDDETRRLDEQAGDLLMRFDALGQEAASCDRKAEIEKVAAQLLEVTAAKSAHMTARLDAALKQEPVAAKAPSVTQEQPKPEPKRADAARTEAPAKPPRQAPPAVAAPAPVWQTETTTTAPAAAVAARPTMGGASDLEFSVEDINAAGRGFFGSISAGLASVIEHAFKSYGRPTGYILGTEGGGAFLAGLRYGEGMLVTKAAGERKVYWQGPSVGYDFGVAGSRVMVLVYNLRDSEDVFTRFAGVDGSAYLVGGVGITFLKKGRLVLAPIRSGLGVRLGASVGYLKFTPTQSYNPF